MDRAAIWVVDRLLRLVVVRAATCLASRAPSLAPARAAKSVVEMFDSWAEVRPPTWVVDRPATWVVDRLLRLVVLRAPIWVALRALRLAPARAAKLVVEIAVSWLAVRPLI